MLYSEYVTNFDLIIRLGVIYTVKGHFGKECFYDYFQVINSFFYSIPYKDSVLLGNSRGSKEARARASAALHNIIHSQPDDKRGRREIRVLHLLEQIRVYCETCWEWQETHERGVDQDKNPSKACSDVFHALVRVWLFG